MNQKQLDDLLNEITPQIDKINELYKRYKFWNGEFIDEYKKNNGFSIDEIVLMYINKKLNIK